nr:hypothetical protein [Pontimonas salivibrio]
MRCSRRECEQSAAHEIVWRNPKIHAEDREKIWLSCAEHETFFVEYLASRSFPVSSRPLRQQ